MSSRFSSLTRRNWPAIVVLAVLSMALFATACGSKSEEERDGSADEADEFRTVECKTPSLQFGWRSEPEPIPLNEPFEFVLRLTEGGEALTGAEVYPRADMPAHGHGMVRTPKTIELGEGLYRVTGMLFHMPGHWVVDIEVIHGELEEIVSFPIDLP